MSLDPALVRALAAIEPYLADVVLSGGSVPRVYAELQTPAVTGALLTTRDIDLAVPQSLSIGALSIDELLHEAGFECDFHSFEAPPVTLYVAGRDGPDEVEIEFISAARGSREGPVSMQVGLTAQAVKFGRLLLGRSWEVSLAELTGDEMSGVLRVPTPAAFAITRL